MKSFVKSLEVSDYGDLQEATSAIHNTVGALANGKTIFAIPHPHRWWEYGSAIQALLSVYKNKLSPNEMKILDVGAGWSPLGPTLSYFYDLQVTEAEPADKERNDRYYCNESLRHLCRKPIQMLDVGVENLPDEKYDAVYCVSVLEHVNPQIEKQGWKNLAERVNVGGLLFITVDCVEKLGQKYTFDELRAQNFTVDAIRERVEMLEGMGLTPIGKPEYTYNGAQVFDFTFFRVGMVKL